MIPFRVYYKCTSTSFCALFFVLCSAWVTRWTHALNSHSLPIARRWPRWRIGLHYTHHVEHHQCETTTTTASDNFRPLCASFLCAGTTRLCVLCGFQLKLLLNCINARLNWMNYSRMVCWWCPHLGFGFDEIRWKYYTLENDFRNNFVCDVKRL